MTQEQTNLIFDLTRRKLEAELAEAEVDARLRQAAAEEEAKLRRELMVKESEARLLLLPLPLPPPQQPLRGGHWQMKTISLVRFPLKS